MRDKEKVEDWGVNFLFALKQQDVQVQENVTTTKANK